MSFETHWKDFEGIMLSETNQIEKDKYCIISLIHRILKKKKHKQTYKQSRLVLSKGRWLGNWMKLVKKYRLSVTR